MKFETLAPGMTVYHVGRHKMGNTTLSTVAGVFTMSSHNEHNGYYGGFCIRVSAINGA